jgi:hypothetical protein
MAKRRTEPEQLKGWQQIAAFLGQPVSVAQRWAKSSFGSADGRKRRRKRRSDVFVSKGQPPAVLLEHLTALADGL